MGSLSCLWSDTQAKVFKCLPMRATFTEVFKLYRKEIVEQLSTYMEKHPQEDIYARLRELGKINTGLADAVEGCIGELRQV